MTSKPWLNLALIAVAATIGWLTLRPAANRPDESTPRLMELNKDAVAQIRIITRASLPIELVKRSGRWQMLSPYDVPADPARVDLLLDFLEARSLDTLQPSASELHVYGLDAPAFSLDIDRHHFEFGAQHPFKPARYVRVDGSVHMVADLVTQHALAGAEAYVDTLLVPPGTSIRRISVPGLDVEQRDNRLVASVSGATPDVIATFIERWRAARAASVESAAPVATTGDSIRITDDHGTTIAYRILARAPALRLEREGTPLVFELAADAGRGLLELPASPATP